MTRESSLAVKIAGAALAATISLGGVGCANNQTVAIESQPKNPIVTRTPRPTFTPQPKATDRPPSTSTSANTPTPESTETPVSTETPTATAIPTETYTEQEVDGIKIGFKNGVPLYYQIPGEEKITFDQEEMVRARERAVSGNRMELIKTERIPFEPYETGYPYSEAKPKVTELPEDVVSEEILREEKGITIIQSNTTKFFVRQAAFENGGAFEDYNTGDKRMIIVFVDTPILAPESLNDPKYERVRGIMPDKETIEREYVQAKESRLAELRESLTYNTDSSGMARILTEIEMIEGDVLTPEEKRGYVWENTDNPYNVLGWFFDPEATEGVIGEKDTTVVVVATGPISSPIIRTLNVTVDGLGNYAIYDFFHMRKDSRPRPYQTHPGMGDYVVSADKDEVYPVLTKDLPFVTYHELEHNFRWWHTDSKSEGWSDESCTDLDALKRMMEGYWTWRSSGYIDNSKYPYIFLIPKEFRQDPEIPEYIITKNEVEKDSGVLT